MITHRAHSVSESFSYEGYGADAEAARAALRAGLQRHAEEMKLAEDFADSQMILHEVSEVHVGQSRFQIFQMERPGIVVTTGSTQGEPGWRAMCEYRHPEQGWGYLDGFGSTEDDARQVVVRAIDHVLAGDDGRMIRRADMMEGIETYAVRQDGAYRGGLVRNAGEPLLDDHLEPDLPKHCPDWLPTVHCDICVMTRGGEILSTASAISYPSRQNRVGISDFLENEMEEAKRTLIQGLRFEPIRQPVLEQLDHAISDMVVGALLGSRGERIDREIDAADVKLLISFRPERTTAASLVRRTDGKI